MLTYFVIVPVLVAIFLYLFSSNYYSRIVAIMVQSVFVFFAFYLFLESRQGEIITAVGGYRGVLGITLRADIISSSFVLLTAILFLIVAIYGLKEPSSKQYWLLMFIWEGLIIGVFLSGDFFNVFVLLEVATLIVAILIMFVREKRSMFDGLIFLMINTVAIQFYLFGVGYLYMLTGTMDMAVSKEVIAGLDYSLLILPYTLIMTATIFKCALMPLASWLPKVQGIPRAPTAVSAILSSLHVKCSLFLFIRFQEVFSPIAVSELFLIIGLATAVTSIIMAFVQTDIKLILAYSSTAQIGLIMVGLNIYGTYATAGSLYHIINHAVFKAALFLGAGVLVRMYKTRDVNKIGGLLKRSPLLTFATLMPILGIIGAPLFNGSISKYFMMAETSPLLYWVLVIINFGTITVYVKYAAMIFGKDTSDKSVHIDANKLGSVAMLGIMCFCLGVFGVWLTPFLFGMDVSLSIGGYLQKTGVFVLSLFAAIVFYRFFGKDQPLFVDIRNANINFRGMCISIGMFFAVMLMVVGVM